MMALVSATFVFVARNFLRNRFYGLMSFAVYQFLIVSKLDKELRTVIVRREQLAFVADKEATAARNFIAGFANRGGDVIRRFIVSIMFERMIGLGIPAVVPPEGERLQSFSSGEFEADFGF